MSDPARTPGNRCTYTWLFHQGPLLIKKAFSGFTASLPENCDKNGLDRNALLFVEYVGMATQWIEAELRDR